MKQKVLAYATLALVCGLYACSKPVSSETPELDENAQSNDLTTLVSQVKEITHQQIILNGSQTRAPWWKWLIFGAADAGGYLLSRGSVSVAISASTLAWTVMKEEVTKEKKDDSDEQISSGSAHQYEAYVSPLQEATESEAPIDYGVAGNIHNEVIAKTYKDEGRTFFDYSPERQNRILYEETINYTGEVPQETVEESLQMASKISSLIKIDMTSEQYVDKLKTLSKDPNITMGFDIIQSVITGLERSHRGTKSYLDRVNYAIETSHIDKKLKETIQGSVSVAYASSKLWKSEALYQKKVTVADEASEGKAETRERMGDAH